MSTMLDDTLLTGLNPAQREAVLHVDGPLLVLAGAGSGKTKVLTSRVARLIAHHDVAPTRILAVTFTNKAAGEMRERIARLLGHEPLGMWMGTFHSIGARLLRIHAADVGRTQSFTIYDQDDTQNVIKRLMERHRISQKDVSPNLVQALISEAKNALTSPQEYATLARDAVSRAVSLVYTDFEGELRRSNAVDFDGLLVLPVELLRSHPEVLERWRSRFQYVLVDEYQDTNQAQYQFVKLIGAGHGNVCVVGDDDQSIYGWRGADIRNILNFNKDFPDAQVVRLEENYRSKPPILELANIVIQANAGRMGKTLRPTMAGGEQVTSVMALDERDEAEFVVEEMSQRRAASALSLDDFALLYRTNAQSRALEEALRRHALPYRLVGAVRFYDRREIRDLMSYLKLVANPADDEAFRRAIAVPRRGVGDTTLDSLAERARAQGLSLYDAVRRPDVVVGLRSAARVALESFVMMLEGFRVKARDAAVDELLRDLVEAIRYGDYLKAEGEESAKERLDNVRELITSAAETMIDEGGEVGLTPLDHFLQRVSLVAAVDVLGADADAVTLMTLHNAKGLEFPYVFITGLEDGLFPLAKAYDDPKLLEEERRLFYVGITRAREKLYLTHAQGRIRNGEFSPARASKFLSDIPQEMLDRRNTIKVRSSGRAFLSGYGGAYGSGWGRTGSGERETTGWEKNAFAPRRERALDDSDDIFPPSPAARRPGTPVRRSMPDPSEESQVAAVIVAGARVRHRKFGSGTIAEVSGVGRDAKAKIDFDDETVGRKTLVVAQANLERGDTE
jgi:DNA helicase II / ATP-dependent DNA helicase PcrA